MTARFNAADWCRRAVAVGINPTVTRGPDGAVLFTTGLFCFGPDPERFHAALAELHEDVVPRRAAVVAHLERRHGRGAP